MWKRKQKQKTFFREKSKQLAEQASAIVGLIVIGEDDGRKPHSDSPNDDVIKVWREEFHISPDAIYRHKSENSGKGSEDFSKSKNRNEEDNFLERNGFCNVEQKNNVSYSEGNNVIRNSDEQSKYDGTDSVISDVGISRIEATAVDSIVQGSDMGRWEVLY